MGRNSTYLLAVKCTCGPSFVVFLCSCVDGFIRVFVLALFVSRLSLLWNLGRTVFHYENTTIQIYRKFHLQKLKLFLIKNSDIFHISDQKHRLWVLVSEAVLTSTHNLCFCAEIKKIIINTPVNPSFLI